MASLSLTLSCYYFKGKYWHYISLHYSPSIHPQCNVHLWKTLNSRTIQFFNPISNTLNPQPHEREKESLASRHQNSDESVWQQGGAREANTWPYGSGTALRGTARPGSRCARAWDAMSARSAGLGMTRIIGRHDVARSILAIGCFQRIT